MPKLQNSSEGDSNAGSLDCESGILQCSTSPGCVMSYSLIVIICVCDYLAHISEGEVVNKYSLRSNCDMAECFPQKSRWCRN